jgi:hypothetical protein
MKKWTRRKFMEAGLAGSVIAGSGVMGQLPELRPMTTKAANGTPASELTAEEWETLSSVMDEIIPHSDSMPAASEVGGVEYLQKLCRSLPGLSDDLKRSLAKVDELSRSHFGKSFRSLTQTERIQTLIEMEQAKPKLFAILRDYTYEAYYIQPRVWKLIDYTFYPTNEGGPKMKPFDESVLAEVRRKPKFYREVE